MAETEMTVKVKLDVADELIRCMCEIMNMWQDMHPGKFVALVPHGNEYRYEICDVQDGGRISRERKG